MEFDKVKELSQRYLFPNYGRLDLAFERGEGCYLYDDEGKQYLDTVAGIAVCSLGYSHPEWVKAMRDQVSHLVHVSNLYYIKEQAQLAQRISTITPEPITRTLFCNSGAEANEGAMKTAVRYTGRTKIMSALNGFHGRTSAAMGATGQKNIQNSFEALINKDAYVYYNFNDLEDVKAKMTKDTAALIVEGIQGESGVHPATREFFRGVRDLCTDNGTLMIVDAVQTGMGRTGQWWCCDALGVIPDIMTTAKGLAAGMPIGAVMSTDEIASVMTPGTHGTTFGGNPLVTASGCAVIDIINREHLLENVRTVGEAWTKDLKALQADFPNKIVDVRGMGFIQGVEISTPEEAASIRDYMIGHQVLVNLAHGKTVRLIPPLIFSMKQKDDFMKVFSEAVALL